MTSRTDILVRLRDTSSDDIEGAALRCLALRPEFSASILGRQLPNGAWTTNHTSQPPNVFLTALALLAIRARTGRPGREVRRGIGWLLKVQPAESHWLWKWKFRLADRQVRFDPEKTGWPWVPGTVSWVAPTALALLALNAWGVTHPRVAAGVSMLLDRACPGGGWNAGNSLAFGVALDPHPDFTAMALLALRPSSSTSSPPVRRALEYLERRIGSCNSSYSLAWITMALATHAHPAVGKSLDALGHRISLAAPPHVLALSALALEETTFTFREFER